MTFRRLLLASWSREPPPPPCLDSTYRPDSWTLTLDDASVSQCGRGLGGVRQERPAFVTALTLGTQERNGGHGGSRGHAAQIWRPDTGKKLGLPVRRSKHQKQGGPGARWHLRMPLTLCNQQPVSRGHWVSCGKHSIQAHRGGLSCCWPGQEAA